MESGDRDLRNVDRVTLEMLPVFGWSVGNYMEEFFEGLRNGRFLGVKCPECGRVYLPPRMICERCFAKNEEWVELPETGVLESFTVAFVEVGEGGDLQDIEAPTVIGMVRHDGADTCLVARVDGLAPGDAAVGMVVGAVLNREAEDVLGILSHYQPVR